MQFSRPLIFLIFLPFLAFARHDYYPTQYQKQFEEQTLTNDELKTALFTVLNSYHQVQDNAPDILDCSPEKNDDSNCHRQRMLSYKEARKYLFGQIYLKTDHNGYYVKDIYCGDIITESMDKIGPNSIPTTKYINTEHTWPQSKFSTNFPKDLQRSDLHHLFPTNSRANSIRSSFNFSEVDGDELEDCTSSSIGVALHGTSSRTFFSPPENVRGDIARALFYFSVRYQLPISATEEASLKTWHKDDPVSADEVERNQAVYEIQGNRNPFIDYAELVDLIDDF